MYIMKRKDWNIYWFLKRTISSALQIIDCTVEIATLTFIKTSLSWRWMFGPEDWDGKRNTSKCRLHRLSMFLEDKEQQHKKP
jgi:hypothetical protein